MTRTEHSTAGKALTVAAEHTPSQDRPSLPSLRTASMPSISKAELKSKSDEELFRELRANIYLVPQLQELQSRYDQQLLRSIKTKIGASDHEGAEDVLQQTWLSALNGIDSFKDGRSFRPWIYTIASNRSVDYHRRNGRHRILSLDATDPSAAGNSLDFKMFVKDGNLGPATQAQLDEARATVREALGQVPEAHRAVLELIYLEGYRYQEVADTLGIALGTVKSRAHFGLKLLHDLLPIDAVDALELRMSVERNAA